MEMMPDKDSLLQKTYDLSEENNKLLKSMRRSQRLSAVVRVIYWLIVAGAAVGLYYYVQPFTDPIVESYGSFREGIGNISEFFNSASTTSSQ